MNKFLPGTVDPCPALPTRFSLGRGAAGSGLAACLWLWTSVGGLQASQTEPALDSAPYRAALIAFQGHDYERALGLTARPAENAGSGERADILNLRGAIYLRQEHFDQARAAFAEAARVDPQLWAARFNEAEVSFRQKDYAASREQFDALLDQTSRFWHPEEHQFLEYKLLLADLCAGRGQPALDFIAAHRTDPAPPQAWYYLNAAVEQRHDHPRKAEEWLARADARHPGGNGKAYAESFERLGWAVGPDAASGLSALASSRRAPHRATFDETPPVARASVLHGRAVREAAGESAPDRSSIPATLAVVQLLPESGSAMDSKDRVAIDTAATNAAERPASRPAAPPAPVENLSSADLPPAGTGLLPDQVSNAAPGTTRAAASANVLAKPRRSRSTPSPAPSATPAPTDTPDTQSGTGAASPTPAPSAAPATPSSDASPTASPSPEFLQKYEAAYVAFLKGDYSTTISLLDEADKIQPKQPQSITLRKQVFKKEYEAAYVAFRKGDYPAALTQLDDADVAQPTDPDALNLRGLVYSKQHAYDQAQTMFKKAVEADPTLWAAKFNYAELPFNRGDYTTARSRFEDLLGETDNAKLPREYELTQYKVFLTLLLEGKTDQARSFMDHFNFSGATPAKYFCNAAMNFRAGSTEKADGWISSAKREYPAQLVTIFIESFYRLGWMTDPNAPVPGTAVASASPAASPGVEAVAPGVTSTASGVPSVTPALAANAPGNTAPAASPVTASPVLLAASSSPSAGGVPVTASAGPIAASSPVTSPLPNASPMAAAPVAMATPRATPANTAAPTPNASAAATAVAASPTTAENGTKEDEGYSLDDALRLGILGGVLLYGVYVFFRLLKSIRRKSRRNRVKRAQITTADQSEEEIANIETPR